MRMFGHGAALLLCARAGEGRGGQARPGPVCGVGREVERSGHFAQRSFLISFSKLISNEILEHFVVIFKR